MKKGKITPRLLVVTVISLYASYLIIFDKGFFTILGVLTLFVMNLLLTTLLHKTEQQDLKQCTDFKVDKEALKRQYVYETECNKEYTEWLEEKVTGLINMLKEQINENTNSFDVTSNDDVRMQNW